MTVSAYIHCEHYRSGLSSISLPLESPLQAMRAGEFRRTGKVSGILASCAGPCMQSVHADQGVRRAQLQKCIHPLVVVQLPSAYPAVCTRPGRYTRAENRWTAVSVKESVTVT